MLVTLVLVFLAGMLVAVRKGWIRMAWKGRSAGSRLVEVQDRVNIGPNHSLCLVRAGGKTLLLGLHQTGCVLLTEVEVPPVLPASMPGAQTGSPPANAPGDLFARRAV